MTSKIIKGSVFGIILGLLIGLLLVWTMFYMRKNAAKNTASTAGNAVQVFADEGVLAVDDMKISLDEEIKYDTTLGGGELNMNPPECNNLTDVILRFHVKANSNSTEDINLKYQVRDAVLMSIGGKLEGNKSREEVLSYLQEHVDDIKAIAEEEIAKAGFSYDVNVYIANDFFPIRQYGKLVLPAGNYQALRIDIGEAKGENFWCILYPMMCYTTDACAVVSEDDEKKLEQVVTEEEFEHLFVKRDVKKENIVYKSKILEWLGF